MTGMCDCNSQPHACRALHGVSHQLDRAFLGCRAAVEADWIEEDITHFTEEVTDSDCSDEQLRGIRITPDFSLANLANLQELLR